MEPLHPKIGTQILVFRDGVEISDDPAWQDGRKCIVFSRSALEQLWTTLNDLQDVCVSVGN